MRIFELIILGVSLAMDACAVSICKGLSMKKKNLKKSLIIAFYFGLFQGIMPIIGYFLGISFTNLVASVDHWIAFVLLLVIGINMIKESNEDNIQNDKVDLKTMLPLAIATSIDALAVGITFAFLEVNIFIAAIIITLITFTFSLMGVLLGNKLGNKYGKLAEILGGVILIILGIKILLEHLKFF